MLIELHLYIVFPEETSVIGFFLHSSVTLYRLDLHGAICRHPLWTEKGGFEFALSHRELHSKTGSILTLCAEVSRSQTAKAIHFFSELYDGINDTLPLGVRMLFCPTQHNAASEEDRCAFVQEQTRYLEAERTMLVKGFAALQSQVRLNVEGTPAVTIRSIIMLLKGPSGHPLFQGIDRQHVESDFLLLKYDVAREEDIRAVIPCLEEKMRCLVFPEDYHLLFVDAAVGLQVGPGFQKFRDQKVIRTTLMVPSPQAQTQNAAIRARIRTAFGKRPPTASPPVSPTDRPKPRQKYNKTDAPRIAPVTPVLTRPCNRVAWSPGTVSPLTGSVTVASTITPSEGSLEIQRLQTQNTALQGRMDGMEGRMDGMEGRMSTMDAKLDNLLVDTNVNFMKLFRTLGIGDMDSDIMDVDSEQGKRKHADISSRAAEST